FSLDLRPEFIPETGWHHACRIATKSVDVKGLQPVEEHVVHVAAELGVVIVQSANIAPPMWRDDLAGGIMLVEIWVSHHHAVPRGVICHHVEDHAHLP